MFPDSRKAWTARCLEHDLSARGATADAAVDSLIKIADAHIAFDIRHGRKPLSAFVSAPQLYWNAFSRAQRLRPVELRRPESNRVVQCLIGTVAQHPVVARYERRSHIA